MLYVYHAGLITMVSLKLLILVYQKKSTLKIISINSKTRMRQSLLNYLLNGWQLKVFMMEYFQKNQMWLVKNKDHYCTINMHIEAYSTTDYSFTHTYMQWSYGVLCWEVFSCGKSPYPGIDPTGVVKLLGTGGRLECPHNEACSNEM